MITARLGLVAAMILGVGGLIGCANEPQTPQEKRTLRNEAQTAVTQMEQKDSSLNDLLNRSYGYAIFPSVAKGGAIVGGASGRGEVYEQGTLIGYAELQQASIGAQLGGQTFAELIVFETREALNKFTSEKFEFAANASAVALKSGAAAGTTFLNGMAVFTMPEGGLMLEASIGGQKFSFQRLNSGNMSERSANSNQYRDTDESGDNTNP